MIQKNVMLQMEDYQGGRNTEGNLRGFTVVMCCEKRPSSVGVIMYFLSSESGKKTFSFKFLVKPVCLI